MNRNASLVYESDITSLVRRYSNHVYCIAQANCIDPTDVDDLSQEIWREVVRCHPRKRPSFPVEAWLVGVALRTAKNWRRVQLRRKRLRGRAEHMAAALETHHDPATEAYSHRVADRLWTSVHELPELQQAVFVLRSTMGYTVQDTAEALGIAEGTVKSSFFRAVRKLRTGLADLRDLWDHGDL